MFKVYMGNSDIIIKDIIENLNDKVVKPLCGVAIVLLIIIMQLKQDKTTVIVMLSAYAILVAAALILMSYNFLLPSWSSSSISMSDIKTMSGSQIQEGIYKCWLWFLKGLPYFGVIAMGCWIITLLSMHQGQIADNNVAPMFYTYLFISSLCLAISIASLFKLPRETPEQTTMSSIFWNFVLFCVTLNIGSNLIMTTILDCYSTQG